MRQCFPWLCAEQQFQLDTASKVMKGGCSPWPGLQPRHVPVCLSLPPGSCRCAGRNALQVPRLLSALGRAASGSALFLFAERAQDSSLLQGHSQLQTPAESPSGPRERGRRGGCLAWGEPVPRRPEGSSQLHQRSAHTVNSFLSSAQIGKD